MLFFESLQIRERERGLTNVELGTVENRKNC